VDRVAPERSDTVTEHSTLFLLQTLAGGITCLD